MIAFVMVNTHGAMALLDRAVTLNWDDGPTLHRITAQVRYHTANTATIQVLRVGALRTLTDNPLTLMAADSAIEAHWTWAERGPGWSTQMVVRNRSEADLFLDALDALRIDAAFGGVFSLGAPPGLWRCATAEGPATWETWSDSAATAGGFVRSGSMAIQPSMSNRTHPPALSVRALGAESAAPVAAATDAAADDETEIALSPLTPGMLAEFRLELSGERFERFTVRARAEGLLLAPGVAVASPEFYIAAGDDAAELLRLP